MLYCSTTHVHSIVLENSGVAEPQNIREQFAEAIAEGHPLTSRVYLSSLVRHCLLGVVLLGRWVSTTSTLKHLCTTVAVQLRTSCWLCTYASRSNAPFVHIVLHVPLLPNIPLCTPSPTRPLTTDHGGRQRLLPQGLLLTDPPHGPP